MFSIDQVKPIENDVKEKIMRERMRYTIVYDVVERYLHGQSSTKNPSIMLGGSIGVQMLLGHERGTDVYMFQYELYAENAFKHANMLTNDISAALSPKGYWQEGEFIVWLKTYASSSIQQKYSIVVDNRPIVTIVGIPNGSSAIISPVLTSSFDKKKQIAVVPAEMMLLDIYRTLYTPGENGDWEESLSNENQLFHHLQEREKIIRADVTGGSNSGEVTWKMRKQIELLIVSEYISNNPKIVLLGEHALYIITQDTTNTNIMHICSTLSPDDIVADIEDLLKRSGIPPLRVSVKDQHLHIMKDYRLRRYVIKIEDKEILYMYNAAHYDLIPFNSINSSENKKLFISIGNPFVILRFLLVEIWIVRWILSLGKIDETYAKKRIDSMLSQVLSLRKRMSEGSASNHSVTTISDSYFGSTVEQSGLKIFQSESSDYMGVYVSEIISQKQEAKEQKKYPDYMPQRYYKDNGEYRKI
jgi:hypothetical protein